MAFICVIDTVFEGLTASWRDEDGKPCVFESRIEAEIEAADIGEDDEPDTVLEVNVTEDEIYDPIDGRVYWKKGEAR